MGVTLVAAAVAGAGTGIRSVGVLARFPSGEAGATDEPTRTRRWIGHVLGGAAVAEALADKAGILPSRTRPLPLTGRALIGGLLGVWAARRRGVRTVLPGAVGAGAAVCASHVATRSRTALIRSGVPDALVGVVEDVAVVALAKTAAAVLLGPR